MKKRFGLETRVEPGHSVRDGRPPSRAPGKAPTSPIQLAKKRSHSVGSSPVQVKPPSRFGAWFASYVRSAPLHVVGVVAGFIVGSIIIGPVISSVVHTAFPQKPKSQKQQPTGPVTTQEVTSLIAKKDYFRLDFPALSACKPADGLFTADRKKWVQAWGACLDKGWAEELQANGYVSRTHAGKKEAIQTVYMASKADIVTNCQKEDWIDEDYVVTTLCSSDLAVYVVGGRSTGDILRDTAAILHGHAHTVQWRYGIWSDSTKLTRTVFDNYPSKQGDLTREKALYLARLRMELNADCAAMGMLSSNTFLGYPGMREYIKRASDQPAGDTPTSYGSLEVRDNMISAVLSQPNMRSCNAWALPDTTIH